MLTLRANDQLSLVVQDLLDEQNFRTKIVILPVYNEINTVHEQVKQLSSMVDLVVVVNDGSTDGSKDRVVELTEIEENIFLTSLPENKGMAAAMKRGMFCVQYLLEKGIIGGEDLVITIDADGQHKPEDIGAISAFCLRDGYDMVVTKRKYSDDYPALKKLGNTLMSLMGSLLAGFRYGDIECGYRIMKAKMIPEILKYYTGYKYSCAQEICIISARLGYGINNDFESAMTFYRAGRTKIRDVLINLSYGFLAFLKVKIKRDRMAMAVPDEIVEEVGRFLEPALIRAVEV